MLSRVMLPHPSAPDERSLQLEATVEYSCKNWLCGGSGPSPYSILPAMFSSRLTSCTLYSLVVLFAMLTVFCLCLLQLPLTYDPEARELISPVGVAYPITASGVPNMMPSCARLVEGQKER